ncbi:hypothetical protein Z043_124314, partial [Scleropages formosus]
MKSKLREISERDRRRWNFDFDTDTPLRGQFEWEEASVDAVPVFYRDSVQRGKARIPVAALPRGSRDCSGREAGALSRVSSPEATGARSAELNRENRAEQLNSGKPQRRALVCIPRKRASTGDLSSSRISEEKDLGDEAGHESCPGSPRANPAQEDQIKVFARRYCEDVIFRPLDRGTRKRVHPSACVARRARPRGAPQSDSQDSQKDFITQRKCSRPVVLMEPLDSVKYIIKCAIFHNSNKCLH